MNPKCEVTSAVKSRSLIVLARAPGGADLDAVEQAIESEREAVVARQRGPCTALCGEGTRVDVVLPAVRHARAIVA